MSLSVNYQNIKSSFYNVFGENDGKYIIANTFTGAVIQTNKSGMKAAKFLIENPKYCHEYKDIHLTQALLSNGCLIDEERNEIEELEKRFKISQKGENVLSIGITTTLSCNFDCVYCYEMSRYKKQENPEKISHIIALIQKNIESKKRMEVLWWGGEPLLKIDKIETYSRQLIKLAKSYNLDYQSSIVSNGYLLTPKIAEILTQCFYVKTIQVTLDGDREDHDQRRFLKSKDRTFDTIIDNLLRSYIYFNKIILRINVDKRNIDRVSSLFGKLELLKQRVSLTIRPVTVPHFKEKEIPDYIFTQDEFAEVQYKFGLLACQKGYRVYFGHSTPGTTFCNAYQASNSWVIDPSGDIQICPVFTGNYKERLGSLSETGEIDYNVDSIQYRWMTNSNPFAKEDCLQCKALPICMGSCLLQNNSRFRCLSKYYIAETMYLQHKSLMQDQL